MVSWPSSSLDRLIRVTRIPWYGFVALAGGALLFLGFATVFFDGILDSVMYDDVWRPMLMGPAIIVYILAVFRPVSEYQTRALKALRGAVALDDDGFIELVNRASDIDDRGELLAFAAGGAFGFLTNPPWNVTGDYLWLRFYIPFSAALMFGLLAWLSFVSVAGTKLFAELHRQPLKVDIFDLGPFEPIGRYALFTSLAFVGGSVISVIIMNPLAEGLNYALNAGLYGFLAVVTFLVFFLSMRPTHSALARAKTQELKLVERKIAEAFRELKKLETEGHAVDAISTRLNLWLRYEDRVKKARTWPYNTPMLRTLFFSILVPAVVSIAQRVLSNLFAR